MEKYNESMYPALSKYVIEKVKDQVSKQSVLDWFEYCKTDAIYSCEYVCLPGCAVSNEIILKAIGEWRNENNIDFGAVDKNTADDRWMVRYHTPSYSNMIHCILMDLARLYGKETEEIENYPLQTPKEIVKFAENIVIAPIVYYGTTPGGIKVYKERLTSCRERVWPYFIFDDEGKLSICNEKIGLEFISAAKRNRRG